jgi:hypothetical protein
MSLSDLASLGSFVSGVAVLVSLVYLALQVRQAERNQRGLMQQGRTERVSDYTLRLAEPGLAEVYWRGVRKPEDLSIAELDRFVSICRAGFLSAEESVLQHKAGLLDETSYSAFLAGWSFVAAMPGICAAWRMTSHLYGSDFSTLMDGLTREARPIPSDEELLGRWKTVVQSLHIGA